MTWAYFDSSALVKRYVDEPGGRDVTQLLAHHTCVTSAILLVELRSAVRRLASEGALAPGQVRDLLKRVATDRAYWTLIQVGQEVLAGAETLVSAHPVRTLDAIHVASAQLFATNVNLPNLRFISADARQIAAAAAIGLTVTRIG